MALSHTSEKSVGTKINLFILFSNYFLAKVEYLNKKIRKILDK
jgi:hypothetical protein